MFRSKSRQSFTLIELLVVLAIVAILSVVVIMTLNPAELLKQARDSSRLSDLSTLNTALAAYSADIVGGFTGTSTVVYVSVPDSSAVCANLGLPALPPTYAYNCVTAQNSRKTDGTGWIPVKLSSISFGSPLSSLPLDPINTTSSGNYYTYVAGGSFQLSSRFESQKYLPQASKTNTYDPGLYVVGNNTHLAPFVGGLVGWWKFDEAGTSTVYDSSGYGNNGVMWQHMTQGVDFHTQFGCKVGSGCFASNGVDSYVAINGTNSPNSGVTVAGWVKKSIGNVSTLFRIGNYFFLDFEDGASGVRFAVDSQYGMYSPGYIDDGNWHFIAGTYDGSTMKRYVDGTFIGQSTYSYIIPQLISGAKISGDAPMLSYSSVNGLIDEVRLYNRPLSAAEIQSIYNSTK